MSIKSYGGFANRAFSIAMTVSFVGAAIMPSAAVAQTATIDSLMAQIQQLQAQLLALQGGTSGATTKCTFTRSLFQGVRGDDVKCLQQYLNSTTNKVAASGPGSPGSETTYFGPATRAAVGRWQAANGVSPAAGYFGTLSRAKYSLMMAGAPVTPPPPIGGQPPVVPAGSGLTVTSVANQPAEGLVPGGAAGVPWVQAIFTASPDGDVTVTNVQVERQGLLDDAVFSGIVLFDESGNRIGTARTLNTDHRANLTDSFVVRAGTSRTITIAADMIASLTSYAGQVGRLTIVNVTAAGSTRVNLAGAIAGKNQTINGTLAIGTATITRGSTDPGSTASKQVGTTAYVFSAVRVTAGSGEDLLVKRIRWYQAGSVAAGDLSNVKVTVAGTEYATTVSSDGKYYIADFGTGISVLKGNNLDVSIKGNIESGSGRTIDFDLQRKTDLIVMGTGYGYNITADCSSCTGTASAGSLSTNTEPFFNAYAVTVSTGTLRVDKASSVTATNIPINVSNTILGGFIMEAKGESIQVTQLILNAVFTGTGTSTNLTSVSVYDENGSVVAGPKDPSSGVVTYTSTFTVPTGVHTYTVKGKLSTTFVNNDTIVVAITPSNITAKGTVTGLSVSPTPAAGQVTANTMTVRGSTLTVTGATSPAAQNVVRGVQNFQFASLQFDATGSGEDVRVTSVVLRDTLSAAGVGDEVNNCILWDGTTQLNTGSNVKDPSDPSSGTTNDVTFTLDVNLIVPKGTSKVANLTCNISNTATNASTHAWGINSGVTSVVVANGKDTNNTITPVVTTATGQTMTIATGGTLTVTLDASSGLTERLGIAGRTDQELTVLKLAAANEALLLERIALTLSSSTASTSDLGDVNGISVTLWDGTTKVGTASFSGTGTRATSTLTAPFVIPKDGVKKLTIKANLAGIGVNQSATRGRLISVNLDGNDTNTTVAKGQSSGTTVNPTAGGDTGGVGVRIAKTIPTVERVAVPTNTLANGDMDLYRFKVTADAAGDVGLASVAFRVSSTSVATTTTFRLSVYKDSAFQTQAYSNNPVNARSVDIVGETSWNGIASTTVTGGGPSSVVFYFNPVANNSNTGTVSGNSPQTFEVLNVPAGVSYYFRLVGTVLSSTAGDNITVALLGDTGNGVNTNNVGRVAADQLDGVGFATGNFIWTPNSTTSVATTTNDWMNGFQVPGLGSASELTQQTFTK